MGQAGDLGILLGDALIGVDEDQAHVAAVDGGDGAHVGILLNGVVHLRLAAHAGGVDEAVLAEFVFVVAVDGVAGGARHVGDDGALRAQDLIEQAGLAHVGLAHDGDADNVVLLLGLLLGREVCHAEIQQVAGAVAVDGGHLDGIAQAQGVELIHLGIGGAHAVALVHREAHGLLGAQQHIRHLLVGGGHAHLHVRHHDDDVGGLDGDLRLAAHEQQHLAAGAGFDAAGVHDLEFAAVPVAFSIDPVAGDAGGILHDGGAPPGQFIEEHRLAHIGAADNGDNRQCHGYASFLKKRS